MKTNYQTLVIAGLAFVIGLSGCAQIEESNAKSTEQALAASGFRMKVAETARQKAKLAGLPQRTLTRTVGPKGKIRFFWADAADCNCLYAGGEAAYDRYQKISVKEQIAEENAMDADMMDWDAWGPLW
ncbi:hypothetical protein [Rhabdochromatium marinum]|uniref:hypothetical protein n=1 Tax=Rhabdochromatium marinum TaxID=48729 RepID=UPI0019072807|nr:hypothetical protein [Rhabdochromatium marinum]MBK1650205.1 hypothetical protein [Rhabdochromatium marinum]